MAKRTDSRIEKFLEDLAKRCPMEDEFLQAVREIAEDVFPFIQRHPEYQDGALFERLTEPDRVIMFRVVWEDDEGRPRVNRGYRVQFSNALGPYKGGLRFHRTVCLGTLKFLGFEQIFKNALTGLSMGGAKGGSDFDPKGKSDGEVMRFCQSFMTELHRHIGPDIDVPAGDIGVGAREIGFLYGQYRRLSNRVDGALTGKGLDWGGSALRPEATGYGAVYFLQEMMNHQADSLEGKSCLVSGSGNVAQYCARKLMQLGGKVLTLSDSTGFIHEPKGLTMERLDAIMELKNVKRGSLKDYARRFKVKYHPGERPWAIKADFAFPCATQNEIDGNDARALVANGVRAVVEGANMPTTMEGIKVFREAKVHFAPGKAANAGGVAVSGLEMAQNSQRLTWDRDEVKSGLKSIMADIHRKCVEYGSDNGHVDYERGANIAGFIRVADTILDQGYM